MRECLAWRLVDVNSSYARQADLFIATKFPSYVARHPNKMVWLWHQHRELYELHWTRYSQFKSDEEDQGVRDAIVAIDNKCLGEAKSIYSLSKRVARRLLRYNGIRSEVLYAPPRLNNPFVCRSYEPFLLCPGRLELNKRLDLVLNALSKTASDIRCVITGAGPQEEALVRLALQLGLSDRVRFTGWVDEATLVDLYSRCLAVVFVPEDEDLGLITLEAFLSKKPVITTESSGAVLEFVEEGVTGMVSATEPEALAHKIDRMAASASKARRLGEAGYEVAVRLSWDYVVDRLTGSG